MTRIAGKSMFAAIATMFAVVAIPATAATVVVSNPYLSQADIPPGFYAGGSPTYLEDFEDGTLGGGITASAGSVVGPGGLADSVDGDDGVIDGSGTDGRSWFTSQGPTGLTFTFIEPVTAAGLVWTDGGVGDITFSAFDEMGALIVTETVSGIPGNSITGQTDEDTFFGVTSAGGIGSIFISGNLGLEVDHVQYGMMAVVPLPAAGVLLFGGLAGLAAVRRRRRT